MQREGKGRGGWSDGGEREPEKRDEQEDGQSQGAARKVFPKKDDSRASARGAADIQIFCCWVGTATGQASSVLLANPIIKTEVGREGECVKECRKEDTLTVRFNKRYKWKANRVC